jgi:hypothetical protein
VNKRAPIGSTGSAALTHHVSRFTFHLPFLSAAAIGYYSIAAIHKPVARATLFFLRRRPAFIQTLQH